MEATNVIQLSDYIPRKPADREPVEIIVNDCVVSWGGSRRGASMCRIENLCAACGGKLEHVSRIGRRLVEHCGCRATKRTIGAEMRPVEAK